MLLLDIFLMSLATLGLSNSETKSIRVLRILCCTYLWVVMLNLIGLRRLLLHDQLINRRSKFFPSMYWCRIALWFLQCITHGFVIIKEANQSHICFMPFLPLFTYIRLLLYLLAFLKWKSKLLREKNPVF